MQSIDIIVLTAVSFVGSFITAAMGIGGGIVTLAVMATLMPAPAVIPVHGMIQLGSNAGRAGLQRRHIDWRTFAWFSVGGVFGVGAGGSVAVTLPDAALRFGLALFILYSIWGPRLRPLSSGHGVVVGMGAAASFLTMFFGATGPFVSAILSRRGYSPRRLVGTHSICMTAQHAFKVVAFAVLGFAYSDWLGLMGLMLTAGFAGTYAGSLVLERLPAKTFALALKSILTLLAVNLLASALGLYGTA